MTARGKRYEAIQAGEQYYITGIPCKNGHVSKRSTETGACTECTGQNVKKLRALYRLNRVSKIT